MVTYIEGNIFSSPAQVIVNTVNTVGVWMPPRRRSFSFADTPEKRDYALRYNRGNQPLTLEANFVFEWLRGGAAVSTSFADVRSVRAAAFLV